MADEPNAGAAPAPPAEPAGDPPARPDFDTTLAALDAYLAESPDYKQKLRSHPIVAGIAGDIAARQKADAERTATLAERDRIEKEWRELAESDPDAFTQRWLKASDVAKLESQAAKLRDATRREFAEAIGQTLKDLPEYSELTESDFNRLAKEITGVPEDRVLPAYVKAATDIVADKRATKRTEAELTKRLAEEKKAWQREQADKRQQARPTPRTAAPPSRSAEDTAVPDWRSPEFDAWYQQNVLGKRPVASRR